MKITLILISLFSFNILAQDAMFDDQQTDFELGGDIFNDYSEGIESSKILEREHFFNYSTFFSVDFMFGWTTFNGERGSAYEDQWPSFAIGTNYHFEMNITIGLGFAYSQNFFTVDQPVWGYPDENLLPGTITVNNSRYWLSLRYFFDTSNLGSAITFANPYLTGRMEYWDIENKFKNQPTIPNESGSGLGFSAGIGLLFPLKMKEYYFAIEFLVHSVNWEDKYTQKYAPLPDGNGYGWDNLNGLAFDLMMGINMAF